MKVLAYTLIDSVALTEAAKQAGITIDQARAFAAQLGELPADQTVRICGEAASYARCGREKNVERQAQRDRRSAKR